MQNDEYRRLKKLIVRSWFLLFLIILGVAFWGSYELKNLHQIFATESSQLTNVQKEAGVRGPSGRDGVSVIGPTGSQGGNGKNGTDGQSVTSQQVAAATQLLLPSILQQYFAQNPVPAGKDGVDGLTQIIKLDPTSCQLQVGYAGEDSLTTIAQLPIPCIASP